jgi:hypothetical protein
LKASELARNEFAETQNQHFMTGFEIRGNNDRPIILSSVAVLQLQKTWDWYGGGRSASRNYLEY